MRQECADLSQIHGSWLAESMLDSPRHIQRRVVGAGCFDDSPPGLRFAFAVQKYRHSAPLLSSPVAGATATPDTPVAAAGVSEAASGVDESESPREQDFAPAVRKAVTAFMAYVLRHFSSLMAGGFLDFQGEADDDEVQAEDETQNSTAAAPSELDPAIPDATDDAAAEPSLTTAALEVSSSPDDATEAGSATEASEEAQVSGEQVEVLDGASAEDAATPAAVVEHPRAAASDGMVDPDTRARLENELHDFIHLTCVSILSSSLARQVLRSSWDILPSMLPSSTRDAIFRSVVSCVLVMHAPIACCSLASPACCFTVEYYVMPLCPLHH